MIKEFLKKAYITESTKYVAIYGSIYYFNERMEDNGINLVIKLGSKTINTISNTIKYFGILYTKKETVAGQKRAMNCSVIDRIHITGMQNFDKSKKLNPSWDKNWWKSNLKNPTTLPKGLQIPLHIKCSPV